MIMDKNMKKDKNSFLIVWISCVVLLFTMCVLGVNSSIKGTSAISDSVCSTSGWVVTESASTSNKQMCCPSSWKYYDTVTKLHVWDGSKVVEDKSYTNGVCVKNPITDYTKSTAEWHYCSKCGAGSRDVCLKKLSGTETCDSGELVNFSYCSTSEMSLCTKSPLSPVSEACYYDVTNGEYVWGVYTTSGTISSASQYTTKSACENANPICYKCSSASEIYGWSTSDSLLANDRSFCPSGGWSSTSDTCFKKKAGEWTATFKAGEGTTDKSSLSCTITVKNRFVNNIKTCSVSVPSATRDGYTFNGWTKVKDDCSSPIKENESEVLSSNVNYYACWTKKSSGNGNGGDTPSTPEEKTITATFMNDNVQFGTDSCTTSGGSCTINAPTTNPTKDGYTFKGWGSSGCTDGWTGSRSGVSSNTTYYACWVSNTPATSSKPDSGGNVSSNPGTGPIAIAITWFVGIFAIAYSIWYFKKIKEN